MAEDPVYKQNRRDAQRRWREAHPDYWRKYRETHPASVEKNRERQRERNRRRTGQSRLIAKTDALLEKSQIIPGRYMLVPLDGGAIGKMDAIKVEIRVVPGC